MLEMGKGEGYHAAGKEKSARDNFSMSDVVKAVAMEEVGVKCIGGGSRNLRAVLGVLWHAL